MTLKQAKEEIAQYRRRIVYKECPFYDDDNWGHRRGVVERLQLCLFDDTGIPAKAYAEARNWYRSLLKVRIPKLPKSPDYSTPAKVTLRAWEGAGTRRWWEP